jgi:hypothetical protein
MRQRYDEALKIGTTRRVEIDGPVENDRQRRPVGDMLLVLNGLDAGRTILWRPERLPQSSAIGLKPAGIDGPEHDPQLVPIACGKMADIPDAEVEVNFKDCAAALGCNLIAGKDEVAHRFGPRRSTPCKARACQQGDIGELGLKGSYLPVHRVPLQFRRWPREFD